MPLEHEALTEAIIGAAIEVHRVLGPGLLEAAYEECLRHELELRGVPFRRQISVPIVYKGLAVDGAYRVDVLVNDAVVVELKAVEQLLPIHEAQLMTYLKLTKKRVGLLINFCVHVLTKGVVRRVL